MIPADGGPSLDGHRETTYAVVHATAPFYSVLIRVNPDNPSSTTDFRCDLCTEMPNPTDSGLTYTFLRNNWYWENLTGSLAAFVEHGAIIGSVGEGRIAYATRADYAAAAAVVATTEGHEGKVYELTGDRAYSYAEIAAEVSRQAGKDVAAVNLAPEEYRAALEGFGLPAFLAEGLADADVQISRGALEQVTDTLSTLIGRPTTPVADAVAEALKN